MNLSRLSGRKQNEYVNNKGRVWKGKTMVIRWLPTAPRHPNVDPQTPAVYVGTRASTRLHKAAVKRNRMRRRCREALRVALKDRKDLPTIQLLLCPRSSSLTCAYKDIEQDVHTFLESIGHC